MLIDVSQPIWAGMPKLPGLPEVAVCPVTEISRGMPLNISRIDLSTHAGTHVDAPCHIVPGGEGIDEVALDRLYGAGAVVGIDRQAGEEISIGDVADRAEILSGDIVLLSTGWAGKFNDESYYDHPYLSLELAEWLVERGVKMVGIDCCTVDMPVGLRPAPFPYPVHHALLDHGVLIIENLADLSSAVGTRPTVYAFPLAVRGADAGHARVVLDN